ncbi:MAG: class I SAM-dependent methyltransferase, partial [Myxococcota bacterium]
LRVVDGQVYLPLGLVALYWLKAYYRPILEFKIRQMNRSDNYGFAKDDFYKLKNICTPEKLKPGAQFSRKNGLIVARALYAARDNIAKMPANYITYPNSNDIVFGVVKKKKNFKKIIEKAKGGLILDREFLTEFGVFKVPVDLWRAFNRYACWIDPAINQEWISLMQNYEKQRGKRNAEDFYKALQWIDPQRKTADIRKLFRQMQKHSPQYCVWSGKRLRHQFAVDHLFPFAHWPNNDLWNLLPTAPDVNSSKSDKLISAKTLNSSRERILNWFGEAYLAQERTKQQFFEEISFSLPGDFKQTLQNIYPLLSQQRIRLKTNQMLEEWNCI